MSCPQPLESAILSDYWIGALSPLEAANVEEHLFACDECAASMEGAVALVEGVRKVAHEGALLTVVSQSFLKRAAEVGLRVREYTPPINGSVECTVTAEDDLLIGRLRANLRDVERVDLSVCDLQGAEQFRLPDIPFDRESQEVLWQQSITFAKAAPSGALVARLIALDESGTENLLGEYTFNHTRTMPGPAGW